MLSSFVAATKASRRVHANQGNCANENFEKGKAREMSVENP